MAFSATQIRRGMVIVFEGDPCREFDIALAAGDIQKVTNLLNDAWFGVPESTRCWQIEGFTEAVGLLEDPPDDGNENSEVEA